jgi:hypothetical protein
MDQDDAFVQTGVNRRIDALEAGTPIGLAEIDRRRRTLGKLRNLEVAAAMVAVAIVVLASGRLAGVGADKPAASASSGAYVLELSATSGQVASGQPVPGLAASLIYRGPEESVEIWHGYGSPIAFGVVEPIDGITLTPGWAQSCSTSRLAAGTALTAPFQKTGISGGDEDAFASFMADPGLRLGSGTWHIYAVADFWDGPCSGKHYQLRAEITIVVRGST